MRVLVFSDDGTITGYGRYSMEVNIRLQAMSDFDIMAASMLHNGLLPAQYNGQQLPYWVAPLGQDNWAQNFIYVLNSFNPDVVVIIKDLSYVELVTLAMGAYTSIPRIIITGIDGKPVAPRWVEPLRSAQHVVSFSQFGVTALAEHDISASQIAPGIDLDHFQPMDKNERKQLRASLGISDDTFVLLTVAQNQHRKAIPHMLEGFFRFAETHPDSLFILNTQQTSLNGWDIPMLCEMNDWDISKLQFIDDLHTLTMAERYNLADAHTVLSHREGWSLPLTEAMACGVINLAMDWCSGTEICGDNKGILTKPLDYVTVSTWGNALDYHPDTQDFADKLTWLADHPTDRSRIASNGHAWARTLSWDTTASQVADILRALKSST